MSELLTNLRCLRCGVRLFQDEVWRDICDDCDTGIHPWDEDDEWDDRYDREDEREDW